MRDRIWLSFDLRSPRGTRAAYRWLAAQGAHECGPGLATLTYAYREDLVAELKEELKRELPLGEGDRVYLVCKDPDDGEATGLFVIGARGPAFGRGAPLTQPSPA